MSAQAPAYDPSAIVARIPAFPEAPRTVRVVFSADWGVHIVPESIPEELEAKFRRFADDWISETGLMSDPIRKFMHRSHLKIIGLGERALPLILREIEKMSGHWFIALDAISPENPVRPEDQTSIERTAKAWLDWGRSKGLI